ncbi:hypothetical protein IAT38_004716 [Cryptococcus sp. DSM 104549]
MTATCLTASSSFRPRFHAVTCYLCSSIRTFTSTTSRPAASWQVEKFRQAAAELRREREEELKLKKLKETAEKVAKGDAKGAKLTGQHVGSRAGANAEGRAVELPGVSLDMEVPSLRSPSRKPSPRPPRPPPPPKATRSRQPYDFPSSSSSSRRSFPKYNQRHTSTSDDSDTYLSLSTPRSPPPPTTKPEATSGTHAWRPTKKLTYSAMAGIRTLYSLDPVEYNKAALSERFGVSYEAISRIVKSKFREKHAGTHDQILAEMGLEGVAEGEPAKAKVTQDVRGRRGKWRGEEVVRRGDNRLLGTKWDVDPRTSERSSPVPALLRAFGKGQLK